jgi:hypothetical protein
MAVWWISASMADEIPILLVPRQGPEVSGTPNSRKTLSSICNATSVSRLGRQAAAGPLAFELYPPLRQVPRITYQLTAMCARREVMKNDAQREKKPQNEEHKKESFLP